jgi:hypothetical protein
MLALNFAFGLETFEATFYNLFLGLANFSQSDFTAAGFTVDDYNYFLLIREHENVSPSSPSLLSPLYVLPYIKKAKKSMFFVTPLDQITCFFVIVVSLPYFLVFLL